MNILVIGSGGREHALVKAIAESESCGELYCSPGNPGIFKLAKQAEVDVKDHMDIIRFCREKAIEMVVVGPEQPLADGIGNDLRCTGVQVFGPDTTPAQLEASKAYAKEFMKEHEIPTARYQVFKNRQQTKAHKFADQIDMPIVIKADGLAAGKGVIIANTRDEAHQAIDDMFGGMFNEAGSTIVIEEFLKGQEASILAVSDGKDYVTLAPSQDHKRALDGDKGANTGGMGAYAPAPLVTDEVLQKVKDRILTPAIKAMENDDSPFIGCLYAGLMINEEGDPYVVEFNVRFGDPETEAVLSILDADFAALLFSAARGELDKSTIRNVASGSACTVIMAAEGYPASYDKGMQISGIEEAEADEKVIVYQAGTKEDGEKLLSAGGRVLAVTGLGADLQAAVDKAYEATSKIRFDKSYYRKDIAHRAL